MKFLSEMPAQPPGIKKTVRGELWDFESQLTVEDEATTSKVVLGVDGGATTTISVCLAFSNSSTETKIVSRAVTGSSNTNSVSEPTAKLALEESIALALMKAQTPRSRIKVVVFGISGCDTPADAEDFSVWARELFPCTSTEIHVYNDAAAALASGTDGRLYGSVLIAGTGTVAYGFNGQKQARAAGFGTPLGDLGGGHGIASQALHTVVRAHDGRGPPTALTEAILDKLQLKTPLDIIKWFYSDLSWARVAALVPTVKRCARNGDTEARRILNVAAQELALSVTSVISATKLPGKDGTNSFPLVLVGGVLEHDEGWDLCKPIIDLVTQAFPGAQPVKPQVEPAVGAALIAFRHYLKRMGENTLSL